MPFISFFSCHTLKYECGFLFLICTVSVIYQYKQSTYDNTIFSNIHIRKSPYDAYKKQIKNKDFFFEFF